ncbi:ANK-REP-region domain-containing protein [Favolaschia claudopus]|uniref:ANK-REP-region domain-containing protein n=1 Tax=Favolaschia claudopus TaxID=2862362 RepID=A0AAW0ALS5_9AGAR
MADVVGAIASILQLIDAVTKTRAYVQDFVRAPQEQRQLRTELDDLRTLLQELQTRVKCNPSSPTLKQMVSPLTSFKITMEKMAQTLRSSSDTGSALIGKLSDRLAWTIWNKKEAHEYLVKIEQFKSVLNSWLLIDLWDMSQEHKSTQGAMLYSLGSVAETVKSEMDRGISEHKLRMDMMAHSLKHVNDGISVQHTQTEAKERSEIIQWISPINFFIRHSDISRSRVPGTGGWLLVEPQFQIWKAMRGQTLWCTGIPGAGKTVLVSMVVDYLCREVTTQDCQVACAYLNHKEADQQSPSNLLAAIWRQLVLDKEIGLIAKKLYQRHFERNTSPSLEEVSDLLRATISKLSRVFILVDAIDEYPEGQRLIFLHHLGQLGSNVNLLITSRPHLSPELLGSPKAITINVCASPEDIRQYIDTQVGLSPRLARHVQRQPHLLQEIHTTIAMNIDGMFLLAKLHIASLSTKNTIKAVREALNVLPKDIHDSYDTVMQRIDAQNKEDRTTAVTTIMWVANAKRPLTVSELTMALAIEPGTRALDEDNMLDIQIILSVCAGLVVIDTQCLLVQLVHHTLQEYLDNFYLRRLPDAQTQITSTLLTFLDFDSILRTSISFCPPPLLDYAQHCLGHAQGQPEVDLRTKLLHFCCQAHQWKKKLRLLWNSPPWNYRDWPSESSPIWVAVAANLLEIVKFLIRETHFWNDPQNPVIIVASYYGHLQMIELLIGNGAHVSVQGKPFGSALQAAVYAENIETVKLLLDYGANTNELSGQHGPALAIAARRGNMDLVQILLAYGADINICNAQNDSALYAAMTGGHKLVTQFLIAQGADVNIPFPQHNNTRTALATAAYHGDKSLVKLLIADHASVEVHSGRYGTALGAATCRGHIEIIQCLLEHGADINSKGGYYNGPLGTAFLTNQEKVRDLLIHEGANINIFIPVYGTMLIKAAHHGDISFFHILVNSGADLNKRGGEYGSALAAAASGGHMNIVLLLLEKGADVNIRGGRYGSALHTAAARGKTEIVKMLLMNGADVLLQDASKKPALLLASIHRRLEIVQLLLDHGAKVNSQVEEPWSALAGACRFGHYEIAQVLLNYGADADRKDKDYGNAFNAAMIGGHNEIVKLLIRQRTKPHV